MYYFNKIVLKVDIEGDEYKILNDIKKNSNKIVFLLITAAINAFIIYFIIIIKLFPVIKPPIHIISRWDIVPEAKAVSASASTDRPFSLGF